MPPRQFLCTGRALYPVAGTWYRADEPGLSKSLTQTGDGDSYRIGEWVRVLIPCSFEQVLSTHHASLSRHEHLEHGELLPGQGNISALPIHLTPKRV